MNESREALILLNKFIREMEVIDYKKFFDLIKSGKLQDALEYKNTYVPNSVYKYYCLDDNDELNKMKLQTLENGKVFLSGLKGFNDPFEGKALYFDEEKLKESNWTMNILNKVTEEFATRARICCFSNADEKEQNMPMWAYYANNHKGFCVEYELKDEIKKHMYPVEYNETRLPGNVLIANFINESK